MQEFGICATKFFYIDKLLIFNNYLMDHKMLQEVYDFYQKKLEENEKLNLTIDILSPQGREVYAQADVPRVFSLIYLNYYKKKYNLFANKLLTWSGGSDLEKYVIGINQWTDLNYNYITGEHDVQNFDLPEKDYDFVWLTQTFEHIIEVNKSIQNIFKHLKSGGYFYANWPVLNVRHMEPGHFYSGITITCILYCCKEAGFNLLECGTWGNMEYLTTMFKNQNPKWQIWPRIHEIKDFKNDFYCPCSGWVLVQKP